MANTKKTTAKSKKKEPSKKEILKQLQNPNLTIAQRNALVEKLYKGIDIK